MRRSLRYGPSSLLPLALCFLISGTENRASSGAPRAGTESAPRVGARFCAGGTGDVARSRGGRELGPCEEVGRRQRPPSKAEGGEGGAR